MITDKNIKNLNNIIGNLSYDEYYKANYKNGKKYKKHRQYSLTDEIEKALELLRLTANENIKIEDEEKVKAFLLKYKITNEIYLLDHNDYVNAKYKNSI